MAFPVAAALIPAAASLAGGLMTSSAQKEANKQNQITAKNQMKHQIEAAKHGLGWRVEDAVAHGLSPLVGAGASTTSISPTSIGMQADTSMGDAVSNMGQNIGNAMMRSPGIDKKTQLISDELSNLGLERARLQNRLLESQITSINTASAGTPGAQSVSTSPSEQTASMPKDASMEASGGSPGWKLFDSSPGRKMLLPSEKLKQAIEDSPYEMQIFISDYLKKLSGSRTIPGHQFDPLSGEHYQDKSRDKRVDTARDYARKIKWR